MEVLTFKVPAKIHKKCCVPYFCLHYLTNIIGVQRYTGKKRFTLNKYPIVIHFWLYRYTSLPYVSLIPWSLQSWPLQLIEHLANTISVAPPPAGPAGCLPLYLLHLLNLSSPIWAPNRCCILQFRAYQSFVCNLFSTLISGK